jgi:hypothetical protein
MDVAGHWTWINKERAFPNVKSAVASINNVTKPVTAYKIFSTNQEFDAESCLQFLKDIPNIKSIVVGVENKEQAEETFEIVKKYYS